MILIGGVLSTARMGSWSCAASEPKNWPAGMQDGDSISRRGYVGGGRSCSDVGIRPPATCAPPKIETSGGVAQWMRLADGRPGVVSHAPVRTPP